MNDTFSRSVVKGKKRIYLVKVARAQRVLLWCVLASLAMSVGYTVLAASINNVVILWLCLAGYMGAVIVSIVQTVRVARATGTNIVVAIIGGLLMFFPCLGLLLMALANQRATRILTDNGAKVGFMGVQPDQMHMLIEGACPKCGYDIRGLPEPTCPECGAAIAR
ncbi:MAG: hypothetical protein JSR77_14810 [Planctomycetes bacterium]|nr:hypothetical protein [Planctomycetota bacterium]